MDTSPSKIAEEEESLALPSLFDNFESDFDRESIIFVEEVITVDDLEVFLDEKPANRKSREYKEYLRLKAKYEHPAKKKQTRSKLHSF